MNASSVCKDRLACAVFACLDPRVWLNEQTNGRDMDHGERPLSRNPWNMICRNPHLHKEPRCHLAGGTDGRH
jgi:hypothetical protein